MLKRFLMGLSVVALTMQAACASHVKQPPAPVIESRCELAEPAFLALTAFRDSWVLLYVNEELIFKGQLDLDPSSSISAAFWYSVCGHTTFKVYVNGELFSQRLYIAPETRAIIINIRDDELVKLSTELPLFE